MSNYETNEQIKADHQFLPSGFFRNHVYHVCVTSIFATIAEMSFTAYEAKEKALNTKIFNEPVKKICSCRYQ